MIPYTSDDVVATVQHSLTPEREDGHLRTMGVAVSLLLEPYGEPERNPTVTLRG